jgi:hypothetical protein
MLVDGDNGDATDPSVLRVIAQGRRARIGRLYLYAPAPSLAGARHHDSNHQRPAASATQRKEINAVDGTAAGRLG